jgi:hypothetical protein
MIKKADDRKQRRWTIRGDMELWSRSPQQQFEHDISSGNWAAAVMLGMVVLLAVVLVVWTPSSVVVPLWVVLLIVLVLLFFPLRWALRRPYTVTAEWGDDGSGKPEELWQGTVRGTYNTYRQIEKIRRTIETESAPPLDGPLKQVITPTPDS